MKVDELRHLEEEDSLSWPARLPLEPPLVPRDGAPEPPRVSVVGSCGWPVIMLPLPRDPPAPAWLVGVPLDLLLDGEVFILSRKPRRSPLLQGELCGFVLSSRFRAIIYGRRKLALYLLLFSAGYTVQRSPKSF